MASHAGLVYVVKTKEGYSNGHGGYVQSINDAEKVDFARFGWTSSLKVLERLGHDITNINERDVSFVTVEPSYDSRIGHIEDLYSLMDYDYKTAMRKTEQDCESYPLGSYEFYKDFIEKLNLKVAAFYNAKPIFETIKTKDGPLCLHEITKAKPFITTESEFKRYYSKDGEVYRLALKLKNPHVEKYFNFEDKLKSYYNNWQNDGLVDYIKEKVFTNNPKYLESEGNKLLDLTIKDGKLVVYKNHYNQDVDNQIQEAIRNYYSQREMHVTRMFGSYILLQKKNNKLEAVEATPIPIKYCPLMVKLLKEVGGQVADELLKSLETTNEEMQTNMMCKLINDVVIKGGYFDTNRSLNSCEANVLFGASETMSSAFKSHLIDAAVIVSNNLGTIITTDEYNTQGAVKRMTGLFYTSPSKDLVETSLKEGIIPVFPYTASIDQLEGVRQAIEKGYKSIAVSVAAHDNYLHKELTELESKYNVNIYKFGLCSTGISKETADIMGKYADVIWSCASKQVKEHIEPNAIAQVGLKIPVHIMTKKGWLLVKNHLSFMNDKLQLDEVLLTTGNEKPIFVNSNDKIKVMCKKDINNCIDCPHPCI